MRDEITHAIGRAIRGTLPESSERMRALASVRWTLDDPLGRHVTVDGNAQVSLVTELSRATVWDGRDNERTRRVFMENLLRTRLCAVLLPPFGTDSCRVQGGGGSSG